MLDEEDWTEALRLLRLLIVKLDDMATTLDGIKSDLREAVSGTKTDTSPVR